MQKRVIQRVVFSLLLPVLTACTPLPDDSIKLATNDWPGYRPLYRALVLYGMSANEVDTISLEYSEHESAFVQGKVDAVVIFEPVGSHLLNVGGNIVFDSSQIPGEIVDVLVVSSQILHQQADKVAQVLYAWFRALDAMQKKQNESPDIFVSMSNLSEAEYRHELGGLRFPDFAENQKLFNQNEHNLSANITHIKKVMLEHHLLNKNIDLTNLYSDQLLLKVKP